MKNNDLHVGQYVAVKRERGYKINGITPTVVTRACVVEIGNWFAAEKLEDIESSEGPVEIVKQAYGTGECGKNKLLCRGVRHGSNNTAVAVEYTVPGYRHRLVDYPEETFWVPDVVRACDVKSTWKRHEEYLAEKKLLEEEHAREAKEAQRRQELYTKELDQIRCAVEAKLSPLGIKSVVFGEYMDEDCERDEVYIDKTQVVIDLIDLKNILDKLETAEYNARRYTPGDIVEDQNF